jgi:hypothetical protein
MAVAGRLLWIRVVHCGQTRVLVLTTRWSCVYGCPWDCVGSIGTASCRADAHRGCAHA